MGELMEQHQAPKTNPMTTQAVPTKQSRPEVDNIERPLPPLPQQGAAKAPSPARPVPQAAPIRGKKRKSTIQIASDKENEHAVGLENLPVLKNNKRTKAGQAAPGTRTASRTVKANSVLSPRSHNSRTLPRSPIKEYTMAPSSPAKSFIARPISPLKPISPFKSAATAATSAISASVHGMIEQAKRGTASRMTRTASKEKPPTTGARGKMLPPPRPGLNGQSSPQRTISQSSSHSATTDISTSSTNTTVVKPKRGRPAAATTKAAEQKSPGMAKRGVARAASAAKTALKRNPTTANKKVVIAEPAAGRRILRKRT